MEKELKIFGDYLRSKRLRNTPERKQILEIFLRQETHVTLDELYALVQKVNSKIDHSTVYRNLKVLVECGLARQWEENKRTYYEHEYQHPHHDHMVCEKCGAIIEFAEPIIEEIQKKAAEKYGFEIKDHRLILTGRCKQCR